jgi:IS5 family transposase
MLRIYFLQQWFNLSDPAAEEALYDSSAMRRFVGIDLGCGYDRRCGPREGGDHQCAILDQECRQGTRSEMHQTKKGNHWYFGMRAYFGVDSRTKLIHAAVAKPANVADSTVLPDLLHGNETPVWGDQAYRG